MSEFHHIKKPTIISKIVGFLNRNLFFVESLFFFQIINFLYIRQENRYEENKDEKVYNR